MLLSAVLKSFLYFCLFRLAGCYCYCFYVLSMCEMTLSFPVLVFCVHTLKDGSQIAHAVFFTQSSLSFSFTAASTATIVRYLSWGSSGCGNFVSWSATHFGFVILPAGLKVCCWPYIPFIVDVTYYSVDGVGVGTGDVLFDGPVSSVPWRNKRSKTRSCSFPR